MCCVMICQRKKKVYRKSWIKQNGKYKFRKILFEISIFVGNPVLPSAACAQTIMQYNLRGGVARAKRL